MELFRYPQDPDGPQEAAPPLTRRKKTVRMLVLMAGLDSFDRALGKVPQALLCCVPSVPSHEYLLQGKR